MPLITKKILVCDRCGKAEEVDQGAVKFDVAEQTPGWRRIADDEFLCPGCADGYGLLMARQQVERDDYVHGPCETVG